MYRYGKPILYTVGVYEIDENENEKLVEMMSLTCDNDGGNFFDNDGWDVFTGRIYKKEGTCPVKSCHNCHRRVPMSKEEMKSKKQTRFYKILEEKEFNNFLELREALERENGADT